MGPVLDNCDKKNHDRLYLLKHPILDTATYQFL